MLRKRDDGWWRVSHGSETGYFPSSFLVSVDELSDDSDPNIEHEELVHVEMPRRARSRGYGASIAESPVSLVHIMDEDSPQTSSIELTLGGEYQNFDFENVLMVPLVVGSVIV